MCQLMELELGNVGIPHVRGTVRLRKDDGKETITSQIDRVSVGILKKCQYQRKMGRFVEERSNS
jgi:hypothetical protein